MNTEALNQLLWSIDPMGTCCNLCDDMPNEYWALAHAINDRLQNGEDTRSAIIAEFDDSFWEACLQSSQKQPLLDQIVTALQK